MAGEKHALEAGGEVQAFGLPLQGFRGELESGLGDACDDGACQDGRQGDRDGHRDLAHDPGAQQYGSFFVQVGVAIDAEAEITDRPECASQGAAEVNQGAATKDEHHR